MTTQEEIKAVVQRMRAYAQRFRKIAKNPHAEVIEKWADDIERLAAERGSVSAHIKPLVWEKTYLGSWRAESPLGDYVVDRCDGWSWGWVYGEEYRGYSCDGLEDGKARAQADLVERISPMLTEGPAIPDGWKLVPIEPTPEMARCLESNIAECLPASEVHVANWRNAYRAMLNASPSPGGTSDAD
jgi:hypothetical protein